MFQGSTIKDMLDIKALVMLAIGILAGATVPVAHRRRKERG